MQSLPTGLQIALAVTCVAAINHTMLNLLVVWSLRRKRRSVQLLGNLRGTLSTRWPVVFDSVCFAFTGLALVPVVVFFAMAWSDIEGPWFAYALALSMFSAVSSERILWIRKWENPWHVPLAVAATIATAGALAACVPLSGDGGLGLGAPVPGLYASDISRPPPTQAAALGARALALGAVTLNRVWSLVEGGQLCRDETRINRVCDGEEARYRFRRWLVPMLALQAVYLLSWLLIHYDMLVVLMGSYYFFLPGLLILQLRYLWTSMFRDLCGGYLPQNWRSSASIASQQSPLALVSTTSNTTTRRGSTGPAVPV